MSRSRRDAQSDLDRLQPFIDDANPRVEAMANAKKRHRAQYLIESVGLIVLLLGGLIIVGKV